MINLNEEQRLGRKAFYLLLARRTTIALILLVIGVVLLVIIGPIVRGAKGLFSQLDSGQSATLSALAPVIIFYLTAIIFALAILFFLAGLLLSWLEYKNYTYTFDEFSLKLRKGILNKEQVAISYRQIQDVNIDRSLAFRLLGVSRVLIDSSANENADEQNEADIILEPIDWEKAEEISELLERRIGVQVIESEKQADQEINNLDNLHHGQN